MRVNSSSFVIGNREEKDGIGVVGETKRKEEK